MTFGSEIVKHLVRVTDIFPGGPGWLSVLCMVAATVGLVVMAWRGSKALVGRFLVLMVLLAIVGAIEHRVPFGPLASTARVTLWLAPVVAFGLAVVLQRVYRAAAARGNATRLAFDVVAFGLSALVLVSAIGAQADLSARCGARHAQVMAEAGPQDVVIIIARSTMLHLRARGWYARPAAADACAASASCRSSRTSACTPIDSSTPTVRRNRDRVGR